LWNPGDVLVTRPGEPEQTGREDGTADEHGDESLFGDNVALLLHDACETGLGDPDDENGGETDTDDDGAEGQRAETFFPATFLLERNRVGEETKVEDTIDQGHVNRDENQDRLVVKHLEWLDEVSVTDTLEVDLNLVGFGVDGPVLGLVLDLLRLALKKDWSKGLGYEQETEDAKEKGDDRSDPFGPAPT